MKVNQLELQGLAITYQEAGTGQAVLFIHGWGCDHRIFQPIQEALSPFFRTISLDLPGFGQSTEPSEPWGTQEYTHFIQAFCRALGLEKPHLIVHSYGGRIALRLAQLIPLHKLVITGGAGIKPKRRADYYLKVYSYKLSKFFLTLPLIRSFGAPLLEERRRRSGSTDYRNATPVMRQVLVKAVNEDLRHLLPDIPCPTLLIWGELDTATPLENGRLMEKMIPDAGLVVLKGGTHFAFLEQAPQFILIVKNFLGIEK